MNRVLKTAPIGFPVDTAQVKVFSDFRDSLSDNRILEEIPDAVSVAENFTGRVFVDQQWSIWYDLPELYPVLELSTLNVTSVDSVTVYLSDNTSSVIASTNYETLLSPESSTSKLYFNEDFSLTDLGNLRNFRTMKVDVTAGYGADKDNMPADIQSALSQIVSYWIDTNSTVASKDSFSVIPFGAKKKLNKYKIRTKGGWL